MKKSNPFQGQTEFFEAMDQNKRDQWIEKVLNLKQLEGNPKKFKAVYPKNNQFWLHKDVNLHYYSCQPKQDPEAILINFHGLNSHGGSSGYWGTTVANKCGINTYANDFKNFGLSGGDIKGYIQSFELAVEEAGAFVEFIRSKFKKNVKVFLSGSSFGGGIAFKLAITNPQKYHGLILFSPALRELKQAQPVLKKIGKAIGYLFPTWKFLEPDLNSGTRYKSAQVDPLTYTGKIVPGSIRIVLNSMDELQTEYSKLNTKYILFQSGSDKLVDPFAPLDLQKQCKTEDKTTIYIKDMWHNVAQEQQFDEVVEMAVDWINERK